jgi:hypothetical protein
LLPYPAAIMPGGANLRNRDLARTLAEPFFQQRFQIITSDRLSGSIQCSIIASLSAKGFSLGFVVICFRGLKT